MTQAIMNEHGILYIDSMLQAKEQGLKTVTRRPIKLPKWSTGNWKEFEINEDGIPQITCRKTGCFSEIKCPYGKPGDLLYVKENFQIIGDMQFEQSVHVTYRQDGQSRWVQLTNEEWEKFRKWKQPYGKKSKLFMFKSLARYWDEITDIDMQRVQDITLEEMKAEGTVKTICTNRESGNILWPIGEKVSPVHYLPDGIFSDQKKHLLTEEMIYRAHFYALWDRMYKDEEYAIHHNPWVWVIRYRPVDAEKRAMKAELREGIL